MANVSTTAALGRWCPVGEIYRERRVLEQGAALSYKNHQKQKQGAKNFTLNLTCCFCSKASKFLRLKWLVPCQQITVPWKCSWELMLEQPGRWDPKGGGTPWVRVVGWDICRLLGAGTADVIY